MSILSIIGTEGMGMGLVNYLDNSKSESGVLDTSTTLASSNALLSAQTKKGQNAYSTGTADTAAMDALKKALEAMGIDTGSVTLSELKRYQEQLEKEFSETLRADLEKLGVDKDTVFSLSLDDKGNVTVTCDNALAKEKIEKYLENSPKTVEQFSFIQAFANLGRAQQSAAASSSSWQMLQNMNTPLTAQHLEAFFSGALDSGMGYSSLLASFGLGDTGASFYTGLNYKV